VKTWPGLNHGPSRDKLASLARTMRRAGAEKDAIVAAMMNRAATMAREAKRFPHRLRDGEASTETGKLRAAIRDGSKVRETACQATRVSDKILAPEGTADAHDLRERGGNPRPSGPRRTVRRSTHETVKRAHRWPYGHGRTW
jgi:hypothetical protein